MRACLGWAAAVLVVLGACGRSRLYIPLEAPVDGGMLDAVTDASVDTGARSDAAPDAGRDSGEDRDAAVDAGPDAGPLPPSCDPDDAREMYCAAECDRGPTWHWDGGRCFPITCGTCEGADCPRGGETFEACRAAHASCDATLCEQTGGRWLFWAEACGHYTCGQPPPEICIFGEPACDCGPESAFLAGRGCVRASCRPPLPSREDQCRATGGTWGPFCCDSVCGERCADPCLNPACDCPVQHIFVEGRGCIEAAECFERRAGQSCQVWSRCEEGTICCPTCTGIGCRDPMCRAPVCDMPPVDVCGNLVGTP